MSYAKLHTSLLTSSLWTEDTETRIVWITLLCLADKHGEVQASIPGLAKIAGVSLEGCEKAISKFLSPDKYSRSKVMEGRRLQEIDGGWEIITYAKHRAMASKEDEKEKAAERQQRFRQRNATVTPSNGESRQVTDSNAPSRPVTENTDIADADADADSKTINRKAFVPPTIEEIKARCVEIGLPEVEAEKFEAHHEARGWRYKQGQMKSWRGALTTWKHNWEAGVFEPKALQSPKPAKSYGQPPAKRTETETDRLMKQLVADGIMRPTADGSYEEVPIEELSKIKP